MPRNNKNKQVYRQDTKRDKTWQYALDIVKSSFDIWKKDKKDIQSMGFTWPEHPVKLDDGSMIDGVILCILPVEPETHIETMRLMVERTAAKALCMLRQGKTEIEAFYETPTNSTYWRIPIIHSAGTNVLGKLESMDDGPALGILRRRDVIEA